MRNRNLPLRIAAACFLFSIGNVQAQDFKTIIQNHISLKSDFVKSDLKNFEIINQDLSKSMKGDVVQIQQFYNGIPVYSSIGTALIKDNKIEYYTDTFVKNFYSSTAKTAAISKGAALQIISENLNNPEVNNFTITEFSEKKSISQDKTAIQRLVYVSDENENLRLAYEYICAEPKTPNLWNILVDASNGEILQKNNLTVSCNFVHDAYSSHASHDHSADNELQLVTVENKVQQNLVALAPHNASYNVFPLPIEAPTFGSRSVISNPWILDASPEGWHSDGTNHYTVTRGNNVFAYEDVAGNAMTPPNYLPGEPADGGATRNFDFPYSLSGTPAANRNAAITNLFYMNNRIHDVFYQFGFTESARNFQQNNFGKGGLDDDSVFAEAQDGGGLNNANFATGPDNYNPKMQMYLWSPTNQYFFYNAPSEAVNRKVVIGTAAFGPALNVAGVTGDVKLSSVVDGCTALPAGSLTGKIGLVERGACDFVTKTKNLQNAGATAAIVYNNAANGSTVGNMGGNDASITIPSVLIVQSEGEYIKSKLASTTVNVTLKNDPSTSSTPDGSFDNGIITHEYGHGISNRLTGNGYSCLSANGSREQMGEGWSDFFALMLTNKPGDNATVARGIGTYATGDVTTGLGIRPAKYSPDFAINSFTYGSTNYMGTNSAPSVHSIGFVWATMLWDLHWKYVEKYGYSSDVLANTTNGSSRVLQLVTNGLKLQPCSPTFIDGRNAILAAEAANTNTGGADKCMIWEAFAKRGLGVNASAGSKTNIKDQVENFEVPAECVLATSNVSVNNAMSIYPNPAKDEFFIKTGSKVLGKVNVQIYDASGKLVSSQKIASSDAVNTQTLPNGVYIVKVEGLGVNYSSKLMIKK